MATACANFSIGLVRPAMVGIVSALPGSSDGVFAIGGVEHGGDSEDSASSRHADVDPPFPSDSCPGFIDFSLIARCKMQDARCHRFDSFNVDEGYSGLRQAYLPGKTKAESPQSVPSKAPPTRTTFNTASSVLTLLNIGTSMLPL